MTTTPKNHNKGRPRKPKAEQRRKSVTVKTTEADLRIIDAARGLMSRSSYLLAAALEAAKRGRLSLEMGENRR